MECLPFLPASRSGKPSRQSSSITDSPFVPAPSMNPLFQLAVPSHTQGMSQDAWTPTKSDFSAQCVLEPASAGWDGEILTQVPFVTCLLDLSGSSLLYCPGLPQPPPSQASPAESAFLLQILGGDVDALTEVLASTGKGMTWQGSLAGQAQAGTQSSAAAVPELVTPASSVSQLQLARPLEAEHPEAAEQSISLHTASRPAPLPKDNIQQTQAEGAMNGYGSLLAESATDAFLLTLSPFPNEQQPIHRGCSNLSNTPLADTCPVDMRALEEGLDDAMEDTGIEAYNKARHSPVRRCITSVNVVKRRLPSRMRNQSKTAVMLERMLHAKSVTDQVSAGMAPSIGASSGPSSLVEDSLAFQLPGLPEAMMDSEPGQTTQRGWLPDAGGGMVSPAKSFSQQLPQVSPACQMESGGEVQRPVPQHISSGLQSTACLPLSSSFTSSRGGHRVRRHSSLCLINEEQHQQLQQQQQQPLFTPLDLGRRSVTSLAEPELRQRLELVAEAASGTMATGSEVLPAGVVPPRTIVSTTGSIRRRLPDRMRNQSKTAAMLERILQAQGSDVGNTTSSSKRTVPPPDLPTRASDEPESFRTQGNPVPPATPPVVPMPVPVSVTPSNDGLAWDSISGRASHQLGSSPPQLAIRFAPTVPVAPTVSEQTSASRLEPVTSPLLFQLLDIAEERQTAQQAALDHSQVSTREHQHQPDISLPSLLPDPNPPHTTPTAEAGSPKALQRLAQRFGRSIGKRLRAAVTQLSLKVERSVDSLSNPWASASHLHAMPLSRQHTNSPDERSASSGAESPSLRTQRGVLRGASVPLLPTSPSRSASNLHMMLSSAPHPGTPPSLPGTHTVPSLSESALTGHPTLVRTMSNSCPQAAVLAVQASQMKLPNHQPSACAPSTSDSLQQRLSAPAASGSQPSAAQLASQTMLLPASHVLVQQAKVRSVSVTVRPILHRRTGQRALLVVQQDTSEAQEMEALLADLAESQLNMASNLFPRHIVEFLATSGQNISPQQMSTLARQHHDVTLLFMDIVGFTTMSKQVPPEAVMVFLNTFFGQLDELCDRCGVTKIETAGDCYIVAGGIARSGGNRNPDQTETVTEEGREGFTSILESHDPADSATRVMEFAKAMMACSKTVLTPHNNEPVVIRIGLHTGNCVSGLIGTKLPKFAIFGDTMNTASRMESTCTPGRIQVSEPTAKLLSHEQWEPTGGIEVKGKGLMWTFLWAGQCPDPQPNPVSSASRPDSTAPAESHLQQIQELRWSEEQEQDAMPEMMRTMDGIYIRPSQDINLSELKNASTPGSSSHPCRPTCLSPFTAALSHANPPGAGERTGTSNSGATTQAHMTQRAARALELLQQSRQSNVSAEDKEGTKQRSLSSKHRLALRGLAQATKPAQGWTSKPRPRQVEKDVFVMAEGVEYMTDEQPDAHGQLPLSSRVSTADEMLMSLLSKSCGSVQATSSATITSVADFQAALLPTAPTPQTDSATQARGAESCGASPGEGATAADRKQPLGMHTALAATVGNERVAWRPAPPAQTIPGSAAPGPGDGQPPDKLAEPEAAEQLATSLGGPLAAARETGALGSQACIHPAPPRASRAYIRFSLDHGNVCPPGPAAGQGSGVPPAATDNLLNSRSSITRPTVRPDGADSPGGGKLPRQDATLACATPGSALPQLSASMRLVKLAQHQLLGQLTGHRHHQGRRRSAVLLQPPEDLQSVLEEGRGVGAPEPTSLTARVKRRPMKSSRSFCVPSTQGTMQGLPSPWAQALTMRVGQEADAEASEDEHPTMAAMIMPPPAQPVSRLMCDSSQTLPCRTSRTSTHQQLSRPAEPVGRQQSLASDGETLGTRSAHPRPASLLREVVEGQWLALAGSSAPACPYPAAGWPPAPSASSGMLSNPGPSSAAPAGQQASEVPGARPGAAAPSSPQRVKSSLQSPGPVQADSSGQQEELLEHDALSLPRPKRRPLSSSRSTLDIGACLPRHPPNDPSAQTLVLALPMDGHLDTVEEDALNAITSQSNIQQAAASNDWPVGCMDIAPSAAQAVKRAPADRPSRSWQVLAASSAGSMAAPAAAAAAAPGDRAATLSPQPSGVTAAVFLVSRSPGTGPPDPTPAQAPSSTASPSTRLVQLAHSTQHGMGDPRADSSGQQGVLLEPGALNSHKPSRRPLRSSRSFYINNAE